ncbi:TetR/AcrR family transcriptional regulator C-terminal domain-containing protein [Aeromicrobium sp. Root472D3]|uniref:TetR/AcrR family transcriptional regulator C-terminal domain-containing protein n=1 Tax=Aeromicrobium sp. Root472D3 TaxID=1736540 RepID=UPI0019104689|nr:TetR/AcrR family transcriptional regulator C-terminal domain-containing protein [Aeromicrobium sp. Root472D3]
MSPADDTRPNDDDAALSPTDAEGRVDADAAIVLGDAPPSTRVQLDRRRIVDTALEHIEESGLSTLTMRRLGARLGVEAMSLYHHVPGKEELLDAIVDVLIGDMRADPDVLAAPETSWQDFLQRLAHGVRRVALAHPRSFPLVASRPPEAPWLRPPLRSLDWVETFLSGLTDNGFSDEAAAASYRSFTSFLLGHLLLEVSTLGADIGPLDVLDDGDGDGDDARLGQFPTVMRLRPRLREDHAAAEFEEALEELLERITLVRAQQ